MFMNMIGPRVVCGCRSILRAAYASAAVAFTLAAMPLVYPADEVASGTAEFRQFEDEATVSRIAVGGMPAAPDAEAIRHQAAGFVESSLKRVFVPIELGETSVDGLPCYFLRGIAIQDDEVYASLGVLAFGTRHTHVIWVQGEADLSFERLGEIVDLADRPNAAAAETVSDLVLRTHPVLPKLKELAVSRHREVFRRIQDEDRRRDSAIQIARDAKGDLATDSTNAEELNRRLRGAPPDRIYGWGAKELGGDEYVITFIVESGAERAMHVWVTNTATGSCTNVGDDASRVEAYRAAKRLNLPSDTRLLAYAPAFDMATFKTSDYYRGRGTDPLGRQIP